MTKVQDALRIAARFTRLQSMGYRTTPEECKAISDMCWLTLPMKYRMDKQEIIAMEAQVAMQKLDSPVLSSTSTGQGGRVDE